MKMRSVGRLIPVHPWGAGLVGAIFGLSSGLAIPSLPAFGETALPSAEAVCQLVGQWKETHSNFKAKVKTRTDDLLVESEMVQLTRPGKNTESWMTVNVRKPRRVAYTIFYSSRDENLRAYFPRQDVLVSMRNKGEVKKIKQSLGVDATMPGAILKLSKSAAVEEIDDGYRLILEMDVRKFVEAQMLPDGVKKYRLEYAIDPHGQVNQVVQALNDTKMVIDLRYVSFDRVEIEKSRVADLLSREENTEVTFQDALAKETE